MNVLAQRLFLPLTAALLLGLVPATAMAQSAFEHGWTLKSDSSALRFQSVKNQTKVESSTFATFSGTIDESGDVKLIVALDSVDTKVDLRNVRMRFLLFETFQFPEAEITARIDPALLADLPEARRKIVTMPYEISLHGVKKTGEAEVAVTLLSDDLVAVASSTPISVPTADYNLDNGVRKLEEAASVEIVPSATVSFDFIFARNAPVGAGTPVAAAEPTAPSRSTAVETAGDFDLAACKGRFEILSRTDNINFRSASATLEQDSFFLLDSIVDIVRRCPGLRIEVAGHTDSLGSNQTNQTLSERRAAAVTDYLSSKGVDPAQITSTGYGETRPIVANDTRDHQRRNRRIEFSVLNG